MPSICLHPFNAFNLNASFKTTIINFINGYFSNKSRFQIWGTSKITFCFMFDFTKYSVKLCSDVFIQSKLVKLTQKPSEHGGSSLKIENHGNIYIDFITSLTVVIFRGSLTYIHYSKHYFLDCFIQWLLPANGTIFTILCIFHYSIKGINMPLKWPTIHHPFWKWK